MISFAMTSDATMNSRQAGLSIVPQSEGEAAASKFILVLFNLQQFALLTLKLQA